VVLRKTEIGCAIELKVPKILQTALEAFRNNWSASYCFSSNVCPNQMQAAFIEGWKARQKYEKEKRGNYHLPSSLR
jgi:hypothetical protein